MEIRSVMTPNPACCTQGTTLQEAARLMVENDCGQQAGLGVITERISMRALLVEGVRHHAATRVGAG